MTQYAELYEKAKPSTRTYKPKSIFESYEKILESAATDNARGFKVKNQVRDAGRIMRKRKRVANHGFSYDATERRAHRIDAVERERMSQSARIAANKRKGQRAEMNYKRGISDRKRKSLGWDK